MRAGQRGRVGQGSFAAFVGAAGGALGLWLTASLATAQPSPPTLRLPDTVVPIAYDLQFAEPLPAGEARLQLRFQGRFSVTEVAGLFKQKEAGDWYVLTQMEPLLARGGRDDFQALPGWASGGCSAEDKALLAATFAERMTTIDGGPRSFAKALERIELCIAYRRLQEPALAKWLTAGTAPR